MSSRWARRPATFTVVSTFSGCGGSSLGYELAGGKVLLACEWDDDAVETYGANFPGTPVFHGDVAELDAEEVCRLAGVRPGELDVFDGSPPCQGFSTAGKRKIDDPRNGLFREYVRLLRGLRPRAFVMENVSGMVKGKMKLVFAEALRELKGSGYRVSARLMNAKWFGVPQSRERLIFVGLRDDLGVEPSHPRAQSRPTTLGAALQPHDDPRWVGPALTGGLAEAAKLMRPGTLAGPAFEATKGRRQSFSTRRLSWSRPSSTVTKTVGTGLGGLIHPSAPALLSIDAVKRVGSFPDDFVLTGPFQAQWARVGNCVPPLFMKAIAEHVAGLLGAHAKLGAA